MGDDEGYYGSTGYLNEVKALSQELGLDRVEFIGSLYGDDKHSVYRGAELFILLTYSENFGMTVAEALACGTPGIVKGFNVGIIPFKANKLIEGVSPIKLFEYLAAGIPVVSTYWKEIEKFSDVACLANNDEEFLNCLDNGCKTHSVTESVKVARDNSWKKKAEKFIEVCNS